MALLTRIAPHSTDAGLGPWRPTVAPALGRPLLCALLAVAVRWIAAHPVPIAEGPPLSENQVKAAFLINFPKYTEWPAESFSDSNSPIVIGVLGDTKTADELQKAIAGRVVNGRRVVLKRLSSGEDSSACHILFISAAEQHRSPHLLASLKDGHVLTVGESGDFLNDGGIINLAPRDQKIALEVNLTAAAGARIKISSKLLSVASLVKGTAK